MARKALLLLLVFSLLLEAALTFAGFLLPDLVLTKFGVAPTSDTRFMAFAMAWLLLLVTLVCGLALYWTWKRHPGYAPLGYVLGLWWVGIGLGLYLGYGRLDNLVLDTGKGLLLVLATWGSRLRERTN
ncbi:hypothetical protein HER32_06250 [Hymenobacter sp. BT18]|uniref:hypothetical protein n=1 Tax=Hymenobacter sp. BT18 TaxID=2835648 RepID=UPI00143E1B10|nr:hypothetical protein [Hymenobacter sp. BT18]QIX60798.1 hypothetical protein HER32_06250 [Hymenobacter sp. BT18]